MPLSELLTYEHDLLTTVLDVLKEDTDLKRFIGAHNITATISKNKLPLHYESRAIQVKDPDTDFDNATRSKYKEFARSTVEIYCYENIIDDVEGEPLTTSNRLLKTVGLVVLAIRKRLDIESRINGFYWFNLLRIAASEPIPLLSAEETFDLVGCKTLVYDIRKDISLV